MQAFTGERFFTVSITVTSHFPTEHFWCIFLNEKTVTIRGSWKITVELANFDEYR